MKNKLSLFFLIYNVVFSGYSQARNAPSEEVLSLPLFSKKMVVAHNMTHLIYAKGFDTRQKPKSYYNADGKISNLGGSQQYATMISLLGNKKSLEKTVEFEMRTALKLGVDGFQFFYPADGNEELLIKMDQIILAYFKVAEKKNIDFKFSISICVPNVWEDYTQVDIEDFLSKHIKYLVSKTKKSTKWLKSPDGRYVFFLWVPDGIYQGLQGKHWLAYKSPQFIDGAANAYYNISKKAGIDIAYVYHVRWPEKKEYMDAVLKNYPAIWGWTRGLEISESMKNLAKRCKIEKRTYTQTVYPDYYTSKLYEKAKMSNHYGNMIHNFDYLTGMKPTEVERHAQVLDLSRTYRTLLQEAVDNDADMINFVTWNDYPEGHHLAPEINHNFGFAVLLKYYKDVWIQNRKIPETEVAVVFYKKYPFKIKPLLFDIDVYQKHSVVPGEAEDKIEVVTLLKEAAEVFCNGIKIGDGIAGINVHFSPMTIGKVSVSVKRRGEEILSVDPSEWITDAPFRTDRLTYSYSSEFDTYFKEVFGENMIAPKSDQYVKLPGKEVNWKYLLKK
tara:strand:- start:4517 stop:6187 length:1671 start_codon:yes stop_codon:yes gene_type:complete